MYLQIKISFVLNIKKQEFLTHFETGLDFEILTASTYGLKVEYDNFQTNTKNYLCIVKLVETMGTVAKISNENIQEVW